MESPDQKKPEVHSQDAATPIIKPLRTYEKDVEEARRRAGLPQEQREIPEVQVIRRSVTPPPEQRIPPTQTTESVRAEEKPGEKGPSNKTQEVSPVAAVRTYRSDVAESIRDNKLSAVKIAAIESKKRSERGFEPHPKEPSNSAKNIALVLTSVALVVLGSLLAWYFYQKSKEDTGIVIKKEEAPLIFADSKVHLNVTGDKNSLLTILQERMGTYRTTSASTNRIIYLHFTEKNFLGQEDVFPVESLLKQISQNVPDQFIRSLSPRYMFGYHFVAINDPEPFLILKTTSFENTFAGMLAWEKTMNNDLTPYFDLHLDEIESPETGTTTFALLSVAPEFKDVVIHNVDTRLLRNSIGNVALLYGFPNAQTIIITTNERTFFEVIKRLSTNP